MKMQSIPAQIAALQDMPTDALRDKWRELFESEPPRFNRAYLEPRLAYRIQELAHGGLSKSTRSRITELCDDVRAKREPQIRRDNNTLKVGAILVREHRGVEHRVRVLQQGFEYQGRTFKSLSAIASHIAGVKWNGWEFFGLKRRK
jgi:hypothetical protein